MKQKLILLLSIFIIALTLSTVQAVDIDNNESTVDKDNVFYLLSNNTTEPFSIYNVTEENYYNYFDNNGNLINAVKENDILNLSGNFTDKSFILTIPVTITSTNSNAFLYDCTIEFRSINGTVSNLYIENHANQLVPILLNGSSSINVLHNTLYSEGYSAYPIALNSTTNSYICGNKVKTIMGKGGAWQHPGIFLGNSHYNYILNNDITVEESNGIYLSTYGTKESNYNLISGNVIRSSISNPSSWSYGIQMMGNYNNATNNTVIGMFRGISSAGSYNAIVNNTIINLTGGFYQGTSVSALTGGDYAIFGYDHTLIANNTILNSKISNAGIYAANYDVVSNNFIDITTDKIGIEIGESNVLIDNNTVNYNNGYGVYARGKMTNVTISKNLLKGSGIGILVKYQSSKKRPKDFVIINNTVNTSNNVAIDIANVIEDTYTVLDNKIGKSKIILPSGEIQSNSSDETPSKIYYIDENNFSQYFDNEGNLSPDINDGDTLVFRGTFLNKGNLTISKGISIIGDNAQFTNTTFLILSSNVLIQNIEIENNNPNTINQFGIFINKADNVTVSGCKIRVFDNSKAYGIFLLDSSLNTIKNNTIYADGNDLTFAIVAYECYNSEIAFNDIDSVGTSDLYLYKSELTIYDNIKLGECSNTYGLLMAYSSNNNIHSNDINARSKIVDVPEAYTNSVNTVVGLDIYFESHNNTVDNNTIFVMSNDPFLYGMGLVGSIIDKEYTNSVNNSFTNNNVVVKGNYFATGFICGNNAINTLFENNTMNVTADVYTYGATFEKSQQNIIKSNNIETNANGNYIIEFYSSNGNTILDNYLKSDGLVSDGIGLYDSSNNDIIGNSFDIRSTGSPEDMYRAGEGHADVIDLVDAVIYFSQGSNNNNVDSNTINSNTKNLFYQSRSSNNQINNNQKKVPVMNPETFDSSSSSTVVTSGVLVNGTSQNGDNVGNSYAGESKRAYSIEKVDKKSNDLNIAAMIAIAFVCFFGYGFFRSDDDEEMEEY